MPLSTISGVSTMRMLLIGWSFCSIFLSAGQRAPCRTARSAPHVGDGRFVDVESFVAVETGHGEVLRNAPAVAENGCQSVGGQCVGGEYERFYVAHLRIADDLVDFAEFVRDAGDGC